jgi:hypothetical protein
MYTHALRVRETVATPLVIMGWSYSRFKESFLLKPQRAFPDFIVSSRYQVRRQKIVVVGNLSAPNEAMRAAVDGLLASKNCSMGASRLASGCGGADSKLREGMCPKVPGLGSTVREGVGEGSSAFVSRDGHKSIGLLTHIGIPKMPLEKIRKYRLVYTGNSSWAYIELLAV